MALESNVQSIRAYPSAALIAGNPIMQPYEMSLETDTGSIKHGDGATAYNSIGALHQKGLLALTGGVPARSNLEWGLGNPTDGALAATGVGCIVAIPCSPGQLVTKVNMPIGATAGGTMTHQFVALYSGIAIPALIGQSTDTTSAAIAASALASWTLTTPQLITAAQCPNGFIYAEVAITAAQIPTALVVSIPTAVGYQWFTNGPLFLAATAGSALAGTAAATIVSPAAKAVAPIVFLT